ncbi:hypothetical protein GF406_12025 [candidate division KSB1 bacterium]|nr:hypothetical protein [candidate division KSB1 bacterium]
MSRTAIHLFSILLIVSLSYAQLTVKNSSGKVVMQIDENADAILGSSQETGDLTTDTITILDAAGIQTSSISGALDVRGDEVRIWSGSGSVGSASGAGDLYVENIVEVDNDVVVADYVGANGGMNVGSVVDPGEAMLRVNADNTATYAIYADGATSHFTHPVTIGPDAESATQNYQLYLQNDGTPSIGFFNQNEGCKAAIGVTNGIMRHYSEGRIFLFTDIDDNDPDDNSNIVFQVGSNSPSQTAPYMDLFRVLGGGSAWVRNRMSALAFDDRTPYPENLQTAYDAIFSMNRLPDGAYRSDDKEHQLDHAGLHPFVRSGENKRDLSATVSAQNEVIKDLVTRIEQLERQLVTAMAE